MAYNIPYSDSDKGTISVPDNSVSGGLSIDLVGRNKTNYGQTIATTQLHLLENFANGSAPGDATEGQLWYDNNAGVLKLNTSVGTASWSSVVTAQSNGDLGTSTDKFGTVYANTFDGVATSAQYADLAERFHADDYYEMGTVVKIGGTNEVTATKVAFDDDVFGVVSENPAFLMNKGAGNDESHPPIAFAGRVQVKVTGTVKKGQRIVSSDIPGVAIAPTRQEQSTRMTPFNVIGRALETSTDRNTSLVWVAIGAK